MADNMWLCRFHAPWLSSNSSHIRYVKCQVLSFKHYNNILIKSSKTLGGQKPNLAAWKRFVFPKFPKFEQKWWTWLTHWKSTGSKIPKIWAKMVNVTITSHLTHWKSAGFTPWVITKSECEVVFRIYRDRLLPWLPNPMRLVSLCNLQFPVKSTLEKNKLGPTFTPWINQNWQSCDSLNKTFLEGKRLDHKDDISCQCLLSIQCIKSSFYESFLCTWQQLLGIKYAHCTHGLIFHF